MALGICVLALAAWLGVCVANLRAEEARHDATKARLELTKLENAVLQDSAKNAATSIDALQKQLTAMAEAKEREREQAAKREAVLKGVKAIPAKEAGVVDMETSKKAVRHINETIMRNSGY